MPGPEDEPRPIDLRGEPASIIGGAIRDSGLVSEGDRGLVLISGGADSVALLLGLAAVLGPERLVALHVNYRLRPEADADERLVRQVCADSGVELVVHEAGRPEGNTQAWAREIRLGRAERIRAERRLDWIAVGHNRSDRAETFLYRLASSPGVRSLLAMPPRSGHVIRPLLSLDRRLIRRTIEAVAPYAEDATNQDPSYARNRIRLEVIPELEEVNPAAQTNVIRTQVELAEDEDALMRLATDAAGPDLGRGGLDGGLLSAQHPAVRRRMLRRLAEAELGRPVAITPELAAEVGRLSAHPEGGQVDLGGGDRLLIESGRILARAEEVPAEVAPVPIGLEPGRFDFGAWRVESERTTEEEARRAFGDPWSAFLDLDRLLDDPPARLALRRWRSGDRIEPLGMQGRKKLQDVFTDALVPASQRRAWPVLVAGEIVIWVPGLVRSRHLLVGGPDRRVLRLHARSPFSV
ncbi:MAG: tRNA lysidine(34) synthetase TilS [Solirubrobacterales bacterium]|nr:tRNA lysidine(34) synthetase TilS [Solirubrobacterales bacterium]OJU93666.1 MAG: tRNA lysidine(34) synthetase TilS [Solirubrobacterales bacterium 67-14]